MGTKANEFIKALTERGEVIVIGGLAIIAHGFNRPTKDVDLWFDPKGSPEEWANAVMEAADQFDKITLHTLPGWQQLQVSQVAIAAEEIGMIRVNGLDCPLDIFRRPNEFPEDSFQEVLSRCSKNNDGSWLPDPIDLAITKDQTDRGKDQQDILFLESLVRKEWLRKLPHSDYEEAGKLLGRFADWETCKAALQNPDVLVRQIAIDLLKEFAKEGDPFSAATLENLPVPPP